MAKLLFQYSKLDSRYNKSEKNISSSSNYKIFTITKTALNKKF